ncbi:MAG: FtsX-like permease family protein [Candidatus Competibacteraceae bacterium]
MYLHKLMLRSLRRHRERGRRLSALIALCIAAIVFLLAMMDSFFDRYVKLFVDTTTAHLAIVHPDAAELKRKPWKRGAEGLLLIEADGELLSFLRATEGVEAVAPIVRTSGEFLVLNGDEQGSTTMVGIDPGNRQRVFPGLRVSQVSERRDLNEQDVPVLRRSVQFWETIKVATDSITEGDLRVRDGDLAHFMEQARAAFPRYFPREAGGEKPAFLRSLAAALADSLLYREVPDRYRQKYDWRLEEAIAAAQALGDGKGQAEASQVRYANKQLLSALFPDAISPVSEAIRLGAPMTFQTSSPREIKALSLPVVIPITFAGFAEAMPLYGFESFMDIGPLKAYLELGEREFTEIAVRLANVGSTDSVKARIEHHLAARGLDYQVLDYQEMGAGYLPTALGVKIGLAVLAGLFVIAAIIFVANMILLAVIKRRREIGTAVALGMSPREYALLFLGEIFVIVTVAWVGGSILGSIAVAAFAAFGMPGVVFFHDGLLYLDWNARHLLLAYLFVLPGALLAALIPVSRVLKLKPVDVLRETQ